MKKSDNKVLLLVSTINKTKGDIENTNIAKREKQEMNLLSNEIRNIGKSGDINSILSTERDLLRWELNKSEKLKAPPALLTSLNNAIRDLDKAEVISNTVKNADMYKLVNDGISEQRKDRVNGLPKDAVHRFIDSNKTRLSNRIKTPELSFEERKLIEVRYSNMNVVKKEYMKQQAQVLGITSKTKSKELER